MTIEEYTTLYDSYVGRGYNAERAFTKTVNAFVALQCSKQGLQISEDSQEMLVSEVKSYYLETRRKYDIRNAETWMICESLILRVIREEADRRQTKRKESAFDRMADMADALPGHSRANYPRYKTEVHAPSGDWDPRPELHRSAKSQSYHTEHRGPSDRRPHDTGEYFSFNIDRPKPDDACREYRTEYVYPDPHPHSSSSSSSRGNTYTSYKTETRTPYGGSHTYTRTYYYSSDPPLQYSSSSYPSGGRDRPAYQTEERTPSGDSAWKRDSRSPSPARRSRTAPRPSYDSRGAAYESSTRRPRSPSPPPQPVGNRPRVCLYRVLDISRSASADEIKKAHRKLSLRWHPDRCMEANKRAATEKMAEINQANDVLNDAKKRKFYDRTGHVPGIGDDI
ncbi:hypothetical protein ACN47E_007785 [Coniothyrium glycines]